MRTTITLTPEADGLVRRVMRECGLSFKDAVNAAILDGLRSEPLEPYTMPVFDMGIQVPMHKALQLAAELDNEEFLRKRELGE